MAEVPVTVHGGAGAGGLVLGKATRVGGDEEGVEVVSRGYVVGARLVKRHGRSLLEEQGGDFPSASPPHSERGVGILARACDPQTVRVTRRHRRESSTCLPRDSWALMGCICLAGYPISAPPFPHQAFSEPVEKRWRIGRPPVVRGSRSPPREQAVWLTDRVGCRFWRLGGLEAWRQCFATIQRNRCGERSCASQDMEIGEAGEHVRSWFPNMDVRGSMSP